MKLCSPPSRPHQCPSLGARFQVQLFWHYPAWHLEEPILRSAPSLPVALPNQKFASSPQREIKSQGNGKGILPIKGGLQREASFIGGCKLLPPGVFLDMALSMGSWRSCRLLFRFGFFHFLSGSQCLEAGGQGIFSPVIRNTFFLLLFRIKPGIFHFPQFHNKVMLSSWIFDVSSKKQKAKHKPKGDPSCFWILSSGYSKFFMMFLFVAQTMSTYYMPDTVAGAKKIVSTQLFL